MELEIPQDKMSRTLEAGLGRILQLTIGTIGKRFERVIDTLDEFFEMSKEARRIETDVFAEVGAELLAFVRIRRDESEG